MKLYILKMIVKILYILFFIYLFSPLLNSQQLTAIYERLQHNPFEQLEKPIGITVFPFTQSENQPDLTQEFYSELVSQPEIHNKFTIYPNDVVIDLMGLTVAEELEATNSNLLRNLKSTLGIEFVVTGTVKNSNNLQFSIYLIKKASAQIISTIDIQESSNSAPLKDAVIIFSDYMKPVYRNINIPDGMVFVKGDWFDMGSNYGRDNEKPVHQVFIDDFFMDKYEVTIRAYSEFCKATGREMPEQPDYFTDEHPVSNVSWEDAADYANWKGKRLPTEAEWEFAALGGINSSNQFSGNSFLDYVGWYSGNSNSVIHPVAKLDPNGYGIFDMSGNVWEWCGDWYSLSYYRAGEGISPTGPAGGSEKVLRGGSFDDEEYFCRVKYRNKNFPDRKFENYGFRCALDVVE
jgi:formylglycine-generating enzyme required for sulfatase activity